MPPSNTWAFQTRPTAQHISELDSEGCNCNSTLPSRLVMGFSSCFQGQRRRQGRTDRTDRDTSWEQLAEKGKSYRWVRCIQKSDSLNPALELWSPVPLGMTGTRCSRGGLRQRSLSWRPDQATEACTICWLCVAQHCTPESDTARDTCLASCTGCCRTWGRYRRTDQPMHPVPLDR